MRIYRRSQTIFVDSTSEVLKKLVFVVWFLWMWIIALISGNRLKSCTGGLGVPKTPKSRKEDNA